ncbi:MAG: GlcG/HbpS family heme-binding protein [Methylococcaceae bacterium]
MKKIYGALALLGSIVVASNAQAGCNALPTHAILKAALKTAQNPLQANPGGAPAGNGGFALNMWATIVDRDGIVCAVAFTGPGRGAQWPGSRVISAQKANTANAFSLATLPLSTANLYTAVQPKGSLFGLQESNPVDTSVAYGGSPANYGQVQDPMVGRKIGGVNVFGGGLALYNADGTLLGAVGVSGDSSCADHNIAWRTRENLALDNIPGGVVNNTDGIDYTPGSAWGHPVCSADAKAIAIAIGAGK